VTTTATAPPPPPARTGGGRKCDDDLCARHTTDGEWRGCISAMGSGLGKCACSLATATAGDGASPTSPPTHPPTGTHLLNRTKSASIPAKVGDRRLDRVAKRAFKPRLDHSKLRDASDTANDMSDGSVGTRSSCGQRDGGTGGENVVGRRHDGGGGGGGGGGAHPPRTAQSGWGTCSHCTPGSQRPRGCHPRAAGERGMQRVGCGSCNTSAWCRGPMHGGAPSSTTVRTPTGVTRGPAAVHVGTTTAPLHNLW